MKIAFVYACLLALGGCALSSYVLPEGTAPIVPDTARVEITPAQAEAVKAGMAVALKERASPIFGPMAASQDEGGNLYVCGMVNAKTSANGYYIGDKPYIGKLEKSGFSMIALGGAPYQDDLANGLCHQYNVQ